MPATIGVLVPNRNYAHYLPSRLGSILHQTRPPAVLAFLDDGSADDSWEVAQSTLTSFPGVLCWQRSAKPSGSVLGQWEAGLALLDTDFVWIAEADDRALPELLATLAACLEADDAALFAFSDSIPIDAAGTPLGPGNKDYYATSETGLLSADSSFSAADFLQRALCPRNLVVNASAVLWRAAPLRTALAALISERDHWLCAGDWRTYVEVCCGAGTVHYIATPLNEHRRHAASVTGSTSAARHFSEVVLLHTLLRERLGPDPVRDAAMMAHLDGLRRAWDLGRGAVRSAA